MELLLGFYAVLTLSALLGWLVVVVLAFTSFVQDPDDAFEQRTMRGVLSGAKWIVLWPVWPLWFAYKNRVGIIRAVEVLRSK